MTNTKRILGVVGLAGALFFLTGGSATVSGDEAKALVSTQGALLLDVRTPEEFAAGHIDGATNIPVQQLEARLWSLPASKDQNVVVYCRSGARSSKAAGILKNAGYTRVVDLGAMSNWKRP